MKEMFSVEEEGVGETEEEVRTGRDPCSWEILITLILIG